MTRADLAAWSGVELVNALSGGHRNQVFLGRRGGSRVVVRRSNRPAASLEWEIDLLTHLREHGLHVPEVIAADDGRRHVNGLQVHRFIEGEAPRDARDWRGVVRLLESMHELTIGWSPRPGFASARQLMTADRGGDVRLDAMPADAVRAVRRAWLPVLSGAECAIHGDLGAGNILVSGDRVALVDWDEARVDVPWFDFAFVPDDVDVALPVDRRALYTAGIAWEVATCWVAEPEYAARQLAALRDLLA